MKKKALVCAAGLLLALLLLRVISPAEVLAAAGKGNHPKPEEGADDISGLGLLVFIAVFALGFIGIPVLAFFLIRYIIRRGKALTAAMRAYAQQHSLVFEGDGRFPRATPLLKRPGGGVLGIVSGVLPGGLTGKLGQFHYSTGTDENRRTYNFATVLAPLPEAGSAKFYCYRRQGGSFLDSIGDAMTQYQTVELESAAFSESYRLSVKDAANMVAIRQLFSPSFIVFLTEQVPLGFWFEVEGGYLCAAIPGEHWEHPDHLDQLANAAATAATRIRNDIAERAGLRAASAPEAPPPPEPPPPADPPPEPPPPDPV